MKNLDEDLTYMVIPTEGVEEALKVDSLLERIVGAYTRLKLGKGSPARTTFHVWVTQEEAECINRHLYPETEGIDWDSELSRILGESDGCVDD